MVRTLKMLRIQQILHDSTAFDLPYADEEKLLRNQYIYGQTSVNSKKFVWSLVSNSPDELIEF